MSNTVKSKKRTDFLKRVMELLLDHETLSEDVSRKSATEATIQSALFARLNKKLEKYAKEYGLNDKQSRLVQDNFRYESKTTNHVNNFAVFSTNHRPDAILEMDGLRICVELKKGDNGSSLRSGLGQCVIYGSEFDFTLYLFVDMTPNRNIKKSVDAEREKKIIDDLWDLHNVMFAIV